jgi:DNA mismatch repair protein MutL
MNKVHILSPNIISKIAAGEVIERPASVVKELLENAIDAETSSIELHLRDAGRTLIHIKDSGAGMAKDDLEQIFQRHATSKIQSLEDLDSIHSLGFRGEALYSIASIADVILRSSAKGGPASDGKTKDAQIGWEIHTRGGERKSLKPVTMARGTELEVRELFYNTPARRKFLKSNTTELNQILNIVVPYTLLYPKIHFLVKHQDKTLIDLNPADSRTKRVAQTLNLREDHFIETENTPDSTTSIKMILGDINIKRARRDMQFIFINGRPVQSKTISFHMNQTYQLIFPPKSFPFFVVMIEIPPGEIDVNIHPAKREVKIKSEHELSSLLRRMCEHALMASGQAPLAGGPQSTADRENEIQKALTQSNRLERVFEETSDEFTDTADPRSKVPASSEKYAFPEFQASSVEEQPALFTAKKENLQSKLIRARYIGPFMNKFLFFEVDKTLFVFDQHAVQERIVFEQLMGQMERDQVEVQHLLAPIAVTLSAQEMNNWEDSREALEKFGLSTTLFDEESVAVHTHPALLKDCEKALRHLLSGESIRASDHATIARRACRSSIMAGDKLNPEQAVYQRDQLIKCRDPFTCPHGRPTVIEITENFLDKQFIRT